MNEKTIASAFLETAALGKAHEAYDKYVAPHFKHHNQYFKGDRESLLKAMQEDARTSPNKSITIKQMIQEGDRVVTYSNVVKDNMDIAVVHIFRFENGQIAELWDLGQIISPDSPNENGLF